MVRFPNAKINIGLNIISKRGDGFHNIETVFYPVDWCDILEVIPSTGKSSFCISGLPVAGETTSNLCLKALNQLKEKFKIPPVQMHLHKIIPMGAGLGGGSSDSTFTLKLLNEIFKLGTDEDFLLEIALKSGSDCPFFIKNRPVFASGRGEKFIPVSPDLNGYHICIVKPPVHISTAVAFSMVKPQIPKNSLLDLIKLPIERWKDFIFNDFEKSVFSTHPVINDLKEKLYKGGAVFAAMSGSGSAVFGIFKTKTELNGLPPGTISWHGILKGYI